MLHSMDVAANPVRCSCYSFHRPIGPVQYGTKSLYVQDCIRVQLFGSYICIYIYICMCVYIGSLDRIYLQKSHAHLAPFPSKPDMWLTAATKWKMWQGRPLFLGNRYSTLIAHGHSMNASSFSKELPEISGLATASNKICLFNVAGSSTAITLVYFECGTLSMACAVSMLYNNCTTLHAA